MSQPTPDDKALPPMVPVTESFLAELLAKAQLCDELAEALANLIANPTSRELWIEAAAILAKHRAAQGHREGA